MDPVRALRVVEAVTILERGAGAEWDRGRGALAGLAGTLTPRAFYNELALVGFPREFLPDQPPGDLEGFFPTKATIGDLLTFFGHDAMLKMRDGIRVTRYIIRQLSEGPQADPPDSQTTRKETQYDTLSALLQLQPAHWITDTAWDDLIDPTEARPIAIAARLVRELCIGSRVDPGGITKHKRKEEPQTQPLSVREDSSGHLPAPRRRSGASNGLQWQLTASPRRSSASERPERLLAAWVAWSRAAKGPRASCGRRQHHVRDGHTLIATAATPPSAVAVDV